MNILLVEDQQRLAQALAAILEDARYHVDVVGDGVSAVEYALSANEAGSPYDALVLDVMLPRMDGFEAMRQIRAGGSSTPVIMLTARDTLHDKVTGLDAGADDYLTKPFQPQELLARLRALTRRSGNVHVEDIVLADTRLNLTNGDLSLVGAEGTVHLTQREFEVCTYFMTNPEQVITKAQLLMRVWGMDNDADKNSVEAYVSFLRKKLGYLGSSLRVVTVRGMGYRLETSELEASDA
ncbi:MAG: response regulator transcription factor [Coriobacteriales bacterium]|jgi:DNA-binding response OmpR family regulator|nr:response regulator transcription factor [Coriobacteriales bacterium]